MLAVGGPLDFLFLFLFSYSLLLSNFCFILGMAAKAHVTRDEN